jgi:hypothetical protein
MKYVFTGHRGDVSLATGHEILVKGSQIELTEARAADLIANDFPIQRATPEEVTTNHGEL